MAFTDLKTIDIVCENLESCNENLKGKQFKIEILQRPPLLPRVYNQIQLNKHLIYFNNLKSKHNNFSFKNTKKI